MTKRGGAAPPASLQTEERRRGGCESERGSQLSGVCVLWGQSPRRGVTNSVCDVPVAPQLFQALT